MFLGLVFTDMELKEEAIHVYNQLVAMGINSSTVYGNLGSLHSKLGNYDDAIANLRLSIQNDEKNPAPYHNLANLYFESFDFENAKRYAMMALQINHKFRQSASLLAVIYSLEENHENAEKYTHIAAACGQDLDKLKYAIAHYKSVKRRIDEEDAEADFDDEE